MLCSGENMFGQCGAGAGFGRGAMAAVPEVAGLDVAEVDGGYCHTVIRTGDGRVFTLGCGEDGQRGDGRLDEGRAPGEVSEVRLPCRRACAAVRAGLNHSLALCDDGRVFAWGSNEMGQLGVPGDEGSSVPVAVPGVAGGVQISAGSTHSSVVDSAGRLWTFGSNESRQLLTADETDAGGPRVVAPPPTRDEAPHATGAG